MLAIDFSPIAESNLDENPLQHGNEKVSRKNKFDFRDKNFDMIICLGTEATEF